MTSVLITTLNLSAVYALLGVGLSLTWAGLGFLNLAHGTTYAGAAYGAWWASQNVSGNVLIVLLGGMVTGGIIGFLLYVVVFLPLDGKRNFDLRTMIATLAIALFGENYLLYHFGPDNKNFPAIFHSLPEITIHGQNVTPDQVGAFISAVIIVALFVVLLEASRMGLGVRALTQNVEGAKLVGINRRTAAIAILVTSGALVGVASVLLGPVYFVSPFIGFQPMIKGLTVAMLGGLGSVRGAVIAAFLVALAEALTATYLGPQYVLVTLFLLVAVVLMVRPRGIAGVMETTRA